ncbi:unnamed protein product [Onchocerca flexuosa]|uniref:WH2 domain-containing protein n=1 Tax=Onchocerca flexuosa TaxID=387005 RepID=A0A183HKP9_9BILA|nr:unnamed protein product [Onchocerca flexuosa]
MSAAGSFGAISGEKRRVAHRPNESVKDVIRGLAFKKQSVAQVHILFICFFLII